MCLSVHSLIVWFLPCKSGYYLLKLGSTCTSAHCTMRYSHRKRGKVHMQITYESDGFTIVYLEDLT